MANLSCHRTLTLKTSYACQQEVQEFWQAELDKVSKPNARALLQEVDAARPLGIKPRDAKPGTREKMPPMWTFYLEQKLKHPMMVLLVRVGQSVHGHAIPLHCSRTVDIS